MIAYAPFLRPSLGQVGVPSDELLTQLLRLQDEIKALVAGIPQGSVDQVRMDAIRKKLDQCIALGPTDAAIKCFTDLRADIQTIPGAPAPAAAPPPAAAPVWPWIVGGLALAGVATLLLSSK